jgi:arylsulfatase A-like enzyme
MNLPACRTESQRRPNIVFLYADDLGYGDLGCFGDTELKTPHLDRLASEGIRLTDFHVTAPVCCPSRSGFLTGRYPQRNGLFTNIRNDMVNYGHRYSPLEYACSPEMTQGLDLREVTIAQFLKNAGYATGVVGKWDSGRAFEHLPLQRGFDFFYGFANTGIDYWTHERYGVPSMFRGNEQIKEEGYATDLFGREAQRFIEENQNGPFFLYVPFNAPHGPSNLERTGSQAPEEYVRMYGEPPGSGRIRYMANITCMDAAVGGILEKLKQLNLEENTLVVFSSDNGATRVGRNTPMRGQKGDMYEGGIRIPFIARWPGRISSGIASDEFCGTLDLFRAFLSVAGADPSPEIKLDGYDILPVLTEQAASQRKEQCWELRGARAARVDNWKWVLRSRRYTVPPPDAPGELYDLSADLGEQHDLAAEKPEVLQMVQERWSSWMDEMARSEHRGPFSRDYFRILGYPRS